MVNKPLHNESANQTLLTAQNKYDSMPALLSQKGNEEQRKLAKPKADPVRTSNAKLVSALRDRQQCNQF